MKKVQAFRIKLVDEEGKVVLEKWPCNVDAVAGCLYLLNPSLRLEVLLEEGEYQAQ